MDMIKQVLANFRSGLPDHCRTAEAIDRGASAEEVAACASNEDLHALAGALFEALEEASGPAGAETDSRVTPELGNRLREFRAHLPSDSATAQAIDRNASLEEISETAQEEGLSSLAALLLEAEQEADRGAT